MSTINSVASATSKLRLTGMATGLDTDATVKQLMSAYNTRLDKMKQDREIVQWKQDLYREVISNVQTFQNTYFDVLKSDTYMLSSNSFAGFDVTSVKKGTTTASEIASATAGADAITGNYSVSNVTLATKATSTGSNVFNVEQADNAAALTINGINDKLKIKVDGTEYNVTIDQLAYASTDDLVTALNDALKNHTVLASDNVTPADLTAAGFGLSVRKSPSDSTKIQFVTSKANSVNISNGTNSTALSTLGFSSTSFDVNTSTSDKMSTLIGGSVSFSLRNGSNGTVNFSYNFSGADKDKTISQIFSDITSKAGLSASYSELNRKFTLSTTSTGASQSIIATDTQANANGDLFLKSLFNITAAVNVSTTTTGSNSTATITNPNNVTATINKEANSYTIDGMSYSLLKNTVVGDPDTTITVTRNIQKPFDKIKEFVTKYNEFLDKIYTKLQEKKSGYDPLTDDQKAAMSSDDINKWETKAKQGILRNDSILQNMVDKLRSALFTSVPGAGIAFGKAIGITTSKDYTQQGKLVIDEAKLKDALLNHGSEIAKLFSTRSTAYPAYDRTLSTSKRAIRTSEEGILQRINDIFNDNISTNRDSGNKKGLLVEEAGLTNDTSAVTNLLYKDLIGRDKAINNMIKKINTKQEAYYTQFSKLESYMNQMNAQSSWLSQNLGS